LRGIPAEFLEVSKEIASDLREVLGIDKRNATSADQRFCVALQAGQGWRMQLGVRSELSGEQEVIVVDYYNLPIRCCGCYSFDHLIRECPSLKNPRTVSTWSEGVPVEDRSSAAVEEQARSKEQSGKGNSGPAKAKTTPQRDPARNTRTSEQRGGN